MSSFDDGEIVAEGIVKADVLQQYVDTLSAIVGECKIHFGENGLSSAAVDPANVAMFPDVTLSTSAFESYDAPGQVRIGVDLGKLDEKLISSKASDLVEFGIDMETRHLRLRYRNVGHQMALIDADSIRKDPDTPELELPNFVEIESDHLEEAYKNVDLVTDHIMLSGDADNETFSIYGEGDVDRAELTYDADDLHRLEVHESAESLYSLAYFKDVVKAMPAGVSVGMEFGDEYPTRWEWTMCDGGITAEFFLAPRIQS